MSDDDDNPFSVENLRLTPSVLDRFKYTGKGWRKERENNTGDGVFLAVAECIERGLHKRFGCQCDVGIEIVAYVKSNGAVAYRVLCSRCLEWGSDIPHKCLTDRERADARVAKRSEEKQTPPCDRCGSTAPTQWHHYWPRALFGENDWGGTWLCQVCHNMWHKVVTPWAALDRVITFLQRQGLWDA
jgi:hypothetical protein